MCPRRFTVTPEPALTPFEKFRLAIALPDELETIMRQRFRTEAPGADDDEIERRLMTDSTTTATAGGAGESLSAAEWLSASSCQRSASAGRPASRSASSDLCGQRVSLPGRS